MTLNVPEASSEPKAEREQNRSGTEEKAEITMGASLPQPSPWSE